MFNVLIPLWIWNTLFSLTLRMTDKKTFQTNWVLIFQEFQAILGSSKRLLQDVNLKRRTVETSWWQFHQIILTVYNHCTWFFHSVPCYCLLFESLTMKHRSYLQKYIKLWWDIWMFNFLLILLSAWYTTKYPFSGHVLGFDHANHFKKSFCLRITLFWNNCFFGELSWTSL